MRVVATQEAGRYIRERGGELFVWYTRAGRDWVVYKVSTTHPADDVEFAEFDAGGFRFFLDRNIERPKSVQIRLGRWPLRRLRVRGLRREGGAGNGGGGWNGDEDVVWDTGGGGGGNGGGNGGGGNGGG